MDLRTKYDQAIQTAKRLGFQGAATQQGDKLHFKGTVRSEDEKNQIWNAIKFGSGKPIEITVEDLASR